MSLQAITDQLRDTVDRLPAAAPYVYNPLDYAGAPHAQWLSRYGSGAGRVVLVGMNPGPFGMAQTGVPFGDVSMVRDWMGISARVEKPAREHPKRPVLGFDCPRGEVSGQRLWGWAQARWGEAATFFEQAFVLNFCPLVFMAESGRNITPDKLAREDRNALFAVCSEALRASLEHLQPRIVVGIGRFASDRIQTLDFDAAPLLTAPHPSPASPIANRGWAPLMDTLWDEKVLPLLD